MVRVANAEKYASTNFENAVNEYKNKFAPEDQTVKKLESIEFESITNIVKTFSEIEIGME